MWKRLIHWNKRVSYDSNFIPVLLSMLKALNPLDRKNYMEYPPVGYIKFRWKQFIIPVK